nr:unnamed protein product [Callosobruchus chinensis]
MDNTLACIINGLLLQREAFSNVINDIVMKPPDITSDIKSKVMSKESEFRYSSDDVLQFSCGRRVEAIDLRIKTFKLSNIQVGTLLEKIPPSFAHLFEEDRLAELSRQYNSSFRYSLKLKELFFTPAPQKLNHNIARLKQKNLKASCLQARNFKKAVERIWSKEIQERIQSIRDISPKELGLVPQSGTDNSYIFPMGETKILCPSLEATGSTTEHTEQNSGLFNPLCSDPASEAEVNMLGNNSMSLHTTSVINSSADVDPSKNRYNNFEEQILLDGFCIFPSNTTEIIQELNNEELSEVVSDCFFGMCDSKAEPTYLEGVQRQNCIPLVIPTNTESEEEPIDDSDKDPNYSPSCTDEEDFDKENPNGLDIVHSDSEENSVRSPLKPRKRIRCEDKWKLTIRMMHTISGKAHKSKTGKQIEAKVTKKGCAQCKKRCTERINQHTIENIFENYWSGSKIFGI